VVVHRLEPPCHLLDGQGREVQESLNGDLSVLLEYNAKILLHHLLLVDVAVFVPRQLLHQAGETESEVVDVLPRPEHDAVPLLAHLL
jgi:hypothetical protein